MMKKLIPLFLIYTFIHPIKAKELIPGGESCGISLQYDGVLITGSYAFYDEENDLYLNKNKFNENDLIIACNQYKVTSIDELIDRIKECICQNQCIEVEVKNNNQIRKERLDVYFDQKTNTFKTGLYISDESSAIGTITYYDPSNKSFGAFGHNIDVNNDCLDFDASEIFCANITSIERNSNKATGKKIGIIDKTMKIGNVKINHLLGIYGSYESIYKEDLTSLEINKPKIGKAIIYTSLDDNITHSYEIYIHQVNNDVYKSIQLEIVDEELLSKTNGIIPGMSGSPIIQDGKLVGAVTHVCVFG